MKEVELLEPQKTSKVGYRTLVLKKIFDLTPDVYKQRAITGKVKSFKRRIQKSTGQQIIISICYTTHDHSGTKKTNPELHYQHVQQVGTPENSMYTSKCKVSCSCLDFLFTDEVALFKKANSDIWFSNGKDPIIKNPKMKPQLCKHLIRIIMEIKKRGF